MADDYANMGHNQATARLGLLAEDARKGLARVEAGEADTIEGWIAYGHALNEGRGLFASDELFGQWVVSNNLLHTPGSPDDEINRPERTAAMWAAAFPDQFEEAREKGSARTVRGIHAKWKELVEARAAIAEAERLLEESSKAKEQHQHLEQAKDEAEAQVHGAPDEQARAEAEARLEEVQESLQKAESDAVRAEIQYEEVSQKAKGNPHVSNNSGNNEWYTPDDILEAARTVMGGFDIDPASSEIANRKVQADRIYTAEDDGLKQEWPVGRIFMNPPYAQPLMGQFADRFAAEVRRGSEGIVLVNNATETGWFQTMAAECSAICFPKTRIRFLDPEGNLSGSPLQGQAIIYCGTNEKAFAQEFGKFGLVVRHG